MSTQLFIATCLAGKEDRF